MGTGVRSPLGQDGTVCLYFVYIVLPFSFFAGELVSRIAFAEGETGFRAVLFKGTSNSRYVHYGMGAPLHWSATKPFNALIRATRCFAIQTEATLACI